MKETTYFELARHFEVELCSRKCQLDDLQRHTVGFVKSNQPGIVHWKPRLVVKRGLWNFLHLVVRAKLSAHGTLRPVEQLWIEAETAYDLGLSIGTRFPREFADTERARVRAELALDPPLDDTTRKRIERWAQP